MHKLQHFVNVYIEYRTKVVSISSKLHVQVTLVLKLQPEQRKTKKSDS